VCPVIPGFLKTICPYRPFLQYLLHIPYYSLEQQYRITMVHGANIIDSSFRCGKRDLGSNDNFFGKSNCRKDSTTSVWTMPSKSPWQQDTKTTSTKSYGSWGPVFKDQKTFKEMHFC